jgi:hypothetical protein
MDQNMPTANIRVKNSFSIENLLSKPNKICHVKPYENAISQCHDSGKCEISATNTNFNNNNNNNVMFANQEDNGNLHNTENFDYPVKQFMTEPEENMEARESFTSPDSSCTEENMDTTSEIASEGSGNSKCCLV